MKKFIGISFLFLALINLTKEAFSVGVRIMNLGGETFYVDMGERNNFMVRDVLDEFEREFPAQVPEGINAYRLIWRGSPLPLNYRFTPEDINAFQRPPRFHRDVAALHLVPARNERAPHQNRLIVRGNNRR